MVPCFIISEVEMHNKHESSTQSSEDERTFKSNLDLIRSEHLTHEMAVSYLFKWKANSRYTEPLLDRLFVMCHGRGVSYLPTIMYPTLIQLHHESRGQHPLRKILLAGRRGVPLTLPPGAVELLDLPRLQQEEDRKRNCQAGLVAVAAV